MDKFQELVYKVKLPSYSRPTCELHTLLNDNVLPIVLVVSLFEYFQRDSRSSSQKFLLSKVFG